MGISKEEKKRRDGLFEQGFKICSICNMTLSVDNFTSDKNGPYGLSCTCQKCKSGQQKEHYQNNKDKYKTRRKRYNEVHKEQIRESTKKYYQAHKDEIYEWRQKWNEENKDKIKIYQKKYRDSNKDREAEYRREYYKTHIEQEKKRIKKWCQTEVGKMSRKAADHRRKALMQNIEGEHSTEELIKAIEFFDGKCAYTGKPLEEHFHIDHVVPVSKGGTNYIWNIVPANGSPNISKSDNDMEEWYRQQSYFSEERLRRIYEWIDFQKSIKGEKYYESGNIEETTSGE